MNPVTDPDVLELSSLIDLVGPIERVHQATSEENVPHLFAARARSLPGLYPHIA
jgi:hypothetical protein